MHDVCDCMHNLPYLGTYLPISLHSHVRDVLLTTHTYLRYVYIYIFNYK